MSISITVLAFAQAQDEFGFSSRSVPCSPADTARSVVLRLKPDARLEHLRVALDCDFASWDSPIGEARELALIPPVSGG